MHYTIIGDIHGRTCWKQLVREDSVNIFVGDYFDPYDYLTYEQLLQNFADIIAFKQQHPETVLLYGNHDLHYLTSGEQASRYDYLHANDYRQVLTDAAEHFHGVAYAIGGHTLVTHAGVSKPWYEKEFGSCRKVSPTKAADEINSLWKHNKHEFSFRANVTEALDFSGESPTHSPLWIRPWTLAYHDLFAGTPYKQVFGHTQIDKVTTVNGNLTCVDCLGTVTASLHIEA